MKYDKYEMKHIFEAVEITVFNIWTLAKKLTEEGVEDVAVIKIFTVGENGEWRDELRLRARSVTGYSSSAPPYGVGIGDFVVKGSEGKPQVVTKDQFQSYWSAYEKVE